MASWLKNNFVEKNVHQFNEYHVTLWDSALFQIVSQAFAHNDEQNTKRQLKRFCHSKRENTNKKTCEEKNKQKRNVLHIVIISVALYMMKKLRTLRAVTTYSHGDEKDTVYNTLKQPMIKTTGKMCYFKPNELWRVLQIRYHEQDGTQFHTILGVTCIYALKTLIFSHMCACVRITQMTDGCQPK